MAHVKYCIRITIAVAYWRMLLLGDLTRVVVILGKSEVLGRALLSGKGNVQASVSGKVEVTLVCLRKPRLKRWMLESLECDCPELFHNVQVRVV